MISLETYRKTKHRERPPHPPRRVSRRWFTATVVGIALTVAGTALLPFDRTLWPALMAGAAIAGAVVLGFRALGCNQAVQCLFGEFAVLGVLGLLLLVRPEVAMPLYWHMVLAVPLVSWLGTAGWLVAVAWIAHAAHYIWHP